MMSWHCYIPLTHAFRLNYEKERIVMIEYSVKIYSNKRRKEKESHQFSPNSPYFIKISILFLSEKRAIR